MGDAEVHKKQQIDSFTDSNNDFTLFEHVYNYILLCIKKKTSKN